ncbi:MAG: hypothetical protein HYZ14_07315 [Bacteroidetes bacterium]|nr:hypothetical protein [Bacteroidota bacterium]
MTKQNAFLVLVVMLFSAHNADLILSGEEKVLSVLKGIVGTTDSSATVAPAGSGPVVHGIDISHWQNDVKKYFDQNPDNWSFVICKATEGVNITDPSFNGNWDTLSKKGIIKGAYHFYHPNDNATEQANYFLATVKSFEKTDLAPIVDVEVMPEKHVYSATQLADSLLVFLNEIETKTSRTPIIYTNYTYGTKYLTDERLARYPLWIADISQNSPRLVGEWKSWYFWQKGKDIIGNDTIDHDVFNGSMNDLRSFIKHY